MSRNKDIFHKEFKVLDHNKDLLSKTKNTHVSLYYEMETLIAQYQHLLKQTVRMANNADANQKALITTNEKIQTLQEELELSFASLEIVNSQLENEKKGLTRFFPDDVVHQILRGEIQPELGGITTQASIMFMDLRGSTKLAENLSTNEFVDLLNYFFSDIFDIIFGISGSVNKMLGDGLLATFGCPSSTKQDAINCATAALRITEHRDLFNQYKPAYLKDDLDIGIGIATNKVFAGNIGSTRLMEYTVIGDPVNLAARLESLTKKFETSILIDGSTNDKIQSKFKTTFLKKGKVRGKQNVVDIYSLDGFK